MSRELVASWLSKLGEVEKDLPLLLVSGYAYTPRMAYDEVNRGTALGNQLQALIETGRFGTSATDAQAIAKIRLQQILQSKPDKPLFATLSNKVFTPKQLLQEIQSGTQIGQQWINSELQHMSRIVTVR